MIILPAIDLKDGRCVRLFKGEFDTAHQVADDALAVAADFSAAGAAWVHMVDLDGARGGAGRNADIVARVAAASGLAVELGGGLRSMRDLEAADALGVRRFVIGSAAVRAPDFVSAAVERYGARVAVGVDARGGTVRTDGWESDSGLDYLAFARDMEARGVQTLIFTDIDTDGMLSGPPRARLAALRDAVSCEIVASGGVASLADVALLRDMGMDGVIIGKAYYTGNINLAEAIAICR